MNILGCPIENLTIVIAREEYNTVAIFSEFGSSFSECQKGVRGM